MSDNDNILDSTITGTAGIDECKTGPNTLQSSVASSTLMVLEKVEENLGNLTLDIRDNTSAILSKQDSALEKQLQLMMNQERLLSATLDRQSEIIRNQELLLSESLESQREIMKRQEKLFANMT